MTRWSRVLFVLLAMALTSQQCHGAESSAGEHDVTDVDVDSSLDTATANVTSQTGKDNATCSTYEPVPRWLRQMRRIVKGEQSVSQNGFTDQPDTDQPDTDQPDTDQPDTSPCFQSSDHQEVYVHC